MPNYKGHLVGGCAAFVIVYIMAIQVFGQPTYSKEQFLSYGALCLLGSLFPDIDTKSKGQRIYYMGLALMIIWAILFKQWNILAILSLLSLLPLLVSHRGIFHHAWFVVLAPLVVPLMLAYNNPSFSTPSIMAYTYFVTGALSHLILDRGFRKTFRQFRFKR